MNDNTFETKQVDFELMGKIFTADFTMNLVDEEMDPTESFEIDDSIIQSIENGERNWNGIEVLVTITLRGRAILDHSLGLGCVAWSEVSELLDLVESHGLVDEALEDTKVELKSLIELLVA